jgi:polysaccharide biosynthesis protein PslJ
LIEWSGACVAESPAGRLRATAVTVRSRPPPVLPSWPFRVLFVAFPLWWVLGLANLIWLFLAVPMALALVIRGRVRAPKGFGIWLLFLFWMLVSALAINDVRIVGWAFRAMLYLAVTVLFLYVYNVPRRILPVRTIAATMAAYWVVVVLGGYLGVLVPHGGFSTPVERLLPDSLTYPYVQELVHPRFAQVGGQVSGAEEGFPPRTQAPFTYSNEWAANFAMLVPFVFIALAQLRRAGFRLLLLLLLPLSLVPAFLSLNRGLLLSLAIGLSYAAVRSTLHGRVRALAAVVLVAGIVVAVAPALPKRAEQSVGESNQTRLTLYAETIQRVAASPLLGYGAPRPSEDPSNPSAGTQGQLWMVLFSHGVPGLVLYLGWYLWAVWRSRATPSRTRLWTHVTMVVGTMLLPIYGMLPSGLAVFMVAAAVSWRELDAEAAPAIRTPGAVTAGPPAPAAAPAREREGGARPA